MPKLQLKEHLLLDKQLVLKLFINLDVMFALIIIIMFKVIVNKLQVLIKFLAIIILLLEFACVELDLMLLTIYVIQVMLLKNMELL